MDKYINLYFCILLYQKILAWTTAAVDNERVPAAIPIVLDILNLHQVRTLLIYLFK